jgi:hypothetical protein
MANARDLLNRLHRTGNYAYFWSLATKRSAWYRLDNTAERRIAFDQFNAATEDLYFSVYPITGIPAVDRKGAPAEPWQVRGRLNNVQLAHCLFAEFDDKDFGDSQRKAARHIWDLNHRPSAIIRSGGGYHCYWFLKHEVTDIETLSATLFQWVEFVGADTSAKDITRVLRIPGTLNHKYQPPRPVQIKVWEPNRVYEFNQLREAIPPPPPPPPVEIPKLDIDLNQQAFLAKALRLETDRVLNAPQGMRNHSLNTAAFNLGQLVSGGLLDRSEVELVLTNAAHAIGLHIDKNCGETGIAGTLRSGLDRGANYPRTGPRGTTGQHPGYEYLSHNLRSRT